MIAENHIILDNTQINQKIIIGKKGTGRPTKKIEEISMITKTKKSKIQLKIYDCRKPYYFR